MCACRSSINRSAKVRYLGEKGADCQAKDHVRCCLFATYILNQRIAVFFIQKGRTALFYAIKPSECEDDEVKDLRRYLVIEKCIDINSVDEVAFLRYFAFSFGNSIFRRGGHPYRTHLKILLSSSFSN